ncbi:hypothetical protein Aperf_G00000060445 [Anoplocephala perfoliata]
MNGKRVHWSQYADEICFLTTRNVIRLPDSEDDDYVSDKELQIEEPEAMEKFGKKNNNNLVDTEFLGVEEYLRRSPQIRKYVYDMESSSSSSTSNDSSFYEDINNFENELGKTISPRSFKSERTQEQNFTTKEKIKKGEELEDNRRTPIYENASNLYSKPSKGGGRSNPSPKSSNNSTDNQSSSNKMQDNHWISPQISLSKWDSNSAKGDYSNGGKQNPEKRKLENRNNRSISSQRSRNRNVDGSSNGIPKSRTKSESRRVRHDPPETSVTKKSNKPQLEHIAEDMKPNLPKPRNKPKRYQSNGKKPAKRRSHSRHSPTTSKSSSVQKTP